MARLRRFHTALLSSLDPAGALRSFYHITANEEKGLEKARNSAQFCAILRNSAQFSDAHHTPSSGLVDFARKEMEAYRLYTVVPRLVEMVEQLTNWYLRMNKERFEGGRGEDERRDSLSVAFEVLMGLCRMMAPLTPFLTELIYQNLRRAVPDAPESVHFLEIPQVVAAAIDPQIEEDMKMMQTLIEKGRAIRDRHGVSLRVPLPTITLVHCSQASLTAIEKLRDYVMEELNVREVKTALVTDADARALVKLKCLPNHTLLGKRFGKAYKGVQDSIRALSHEALAAFLASGSLTVGGEAFGAE